LALEKAIAFKPETQLKLTCRASKTAF